MADEDVSSLIPIEDGSLAKAKPLRQNFTYLDNRITAQASNISNKESMSRKGAPNGYCPLDNAGKVPASYLTLILGAIYTVGGVYITTVDSETCPIASLIPNSTWEKVASGRVLQGADEEHEAGTTIAAGLPNITGHCGGGDQSPYASASGAFTIYGRGDGREKIEPGTGRAYSFDASRVSSIYGASSTVQPPAYVVVIWRRTA